METFTYFYRSESPFSQWYPANFKIDGHQFNCAEQYMMYCKAILFKDITSSQLILRTQTPREQKELGRKIRGFDKAIWERNCKAFVYEGNYEKFSQNKDLLQILLDTRGTSLVEASPTDRIWGAGLTEDDPRILNRATWRGTNWLGEILTELRDNLLQRN